MSQIIGKPANWAMVVLCLLIGSNGLVSYRNLQRMWSDMRRAESARRGAGHGGEPAVGSNFPMGAREFAVVGTPAAADIPVQIEPQLRRQLAILEDATLISDPLRSRLRLLRSQTAEILDLSRRLIQCAQEGSEAATRQVAAGYGHATLEALESNVAEIRAEQRRMLAEVTLQSDANYRTTLVNLVSATTGACCSWARSTAWCGAIERSETRTEMLLRYGEAKFRRLFDANVMGVLFTELNGHVTEANDAYLENDRRHCREISWRDASIARRITPPSIARWTSGPSPNWPPAAWRLLSRRSIWRADGVRVPCLVAAAMLEEPSSLCICYAIDLTDRKHYEQTIQRLNRELQDRVHELETLFELLPVGLGMAKDPECREIAINGEFIRLLGLPRAAHR